MLGEPKREVVIPGADGHCPESTGRYCQGETRVDLATNVARIMCPLVTFGACSAPKAEAPTSSEVLA